MVNKRNFINWALLIIWMAFIFFMSNQPATISDEQSRSVLKFLSIIHIDMNNIFGKMENFAIRKSAHFIEYMILGLLIFNVLKIYFDLKVLIFISIVFVFMYACSDEIHQLFIVGREATFRDVIIDTCGGNVMILLKNYVFSNKIK